jgi:DNA-binding response OmpR family regulator
MSLALNLVGNNVTSRANILVVEDDDLIRSQISGYLRLRGFVVFEAGTADDARSFLEHGTVHIDCVFSDVQMPGSSDGVGLARWTLAHRPGTPVLLTSGTYRSEDLDPVLRPRLRVLPKPYRGHAVEAGIAALLERCAH